MGRAPCCAKEGMNRGAWTAIEDKLLVDHISSNGEGKWRSIPKEAGLNRCGKSCRLRWLNYLRPDIKRGNITPDEEDLITRLHKLLGNRWSLIAGRLPGRTDNEIKNYWNTTLLKKIHAPDPPKRDTRPSKPEASNKVVRTKAVRIAPSARLPLGNVGEHKHKWNNNASGSDHNSPTTTTTTTTYSGEDFSGLKSLPLETGDVFAHADDPTGHGSDTDFWSMLNEWIMDEEPNYMA